MKLQIGELYFVSDTKYDILMSSTDNEIIAVSYTRNVLDVEKEYQSLYFVNG